ncbi:hypothetical protein AD006_28795 (plasmid) [Pseudonocardia sp. EC080610-09]|uniref:hypothetical protein n=1 Tax=unclassified Pseudonocardia TaxID=2619320 RepID=UPI000706D3DC|nr:MULTISPECIES: hypothetical protein [unclassified Pseudonocardia]ALL79313.1 hypothetical protein AD006_28795 [Pseudonocardia sp. EC080610-09]ALL85284.1 hypothetical protein AD017_29185 [Pseudonocardia sp. EC080619-01]
MTITSRNTSPDTGTGARLGEVLNLDRLRECSTRFDGLGVHIAPDPHWIRLVVADHDGAVEMRWLATQWATRAGTAGLSVTLHSVHPLARDGWPRSWVRTASSPATRSPSGSTTPTRSPTMP